MIYVTNSADNMVSVIDGKTNKIVANIPVGKSPHHRAINPVTNFIYVIQRDNIVSVIDGKTNKVLSGLSFHIHPSSSGIIMCNGRKIMNDIFIRYPIDTHLYCQAIQNGGFAFSSWSGDLNPNAFNQGWTISSFINSLVNFLSLQTNNDQNSNPKALFYPTGYANLTANFRDSPSPIPESYLVGLYTLTITVFTGWFVPNISRWLNARLQGKQLKKYMNEVYMLNNQLPQNEGENAVHNIKRKITEGYTEGKISESHYKILNDLISSYINNNNSKNTNLHSDDKTGTK